MRNTLTLSVHQVEEQHGDVVSFRAILWRGSLLMKHDESMKLVLESTHPNFFVAVRSLKAAVKEWQGRMKEGQEKLWKEAQIVQGINTNVACWPIDTSTKSSEIFSVTDHLMDIAPTGLELRRYQTESWAYVNELWIIRTPMPIPSETLHEVVYNVHYQISFLSSNLFEATEQVLQLAKRPSEEKGSVVGLYDSSPCWPKGL